MSTRLSRLSCERVFCLPWQRCIEGQCSCKPPYLCPFEGVEPVCGQDSRNYRSYCQVWVLQSIRTLFPLFFFGLFCLFLTPWWCVSQAMAVSCLTRKTRMSHFGQLCSGSSTPTHSKQCKYICCWITSGLFFSLTAVEFPKFQSLIHEDTGVVVISLPSDGDREDVLVCNELWDMAAANVACREHHHPLWGDTFSTHLRGLFTMLRVDELKSRNFTMCSGVQHLQERWTTALWWPTGPCSSLVAVSASDAKATRHLWPSARSMTRWKLKTRQLSPWQPATTNTQTVSIWLCSSRLLPH